MVKVAYQPIELSFWYMKNIEDMMNIHICDSYIIPRRWYIWNGIVVSIQSDMNDEFNVQIQIQSLFITEMKTSLKVPQSNVNFTSNNLFLHIHWYTPIVRTNSNSTNCG